MKTILVIFTVVLVGVCFGDNQFNKNSDKFSNDNSKALEDEIYGRLMVLAQNASSHGYPQGLALGLPSIRDTIKNFLHPKQCFKSFYPCILSSQCCSKTCFPIIPALPVPQCLPFHIPFIGV